MESLLDTKTKEPRGGEIDLTNQVGNVSNDTSLLLPDQDPAQQMPEPPNLVPPDLMPPRDIRPNVGQINLYPGVEIDLGVVAGPTVDQRTARNRAEMYSFALQGDTPGVDALAKDVEKGSTNELRTTLATREANAYRVASLDLIQTVAAGQPVTQEDVKSLTNTVKVDPETVIEKKFGDAFSKWALDMSAHDPTMQKYLNKDPESVLNVVDAVSEVGAKRLFFQTKAEELRAENEKMGWGQYIWNVGEQLAPFVSWYQLHTALKQPAESNVLPGSTVEEQITNLYLLPLNQMKDKFNEIMADLKNRNPLLAASFAAAAVQSSYEDRVMENIVAVTDVLGVMAPFTQPLKKAAVGAAGRVLTQDEINKIRVNFAVMTGKENAGRIVTEPRSMTLKELNTTREGLNIPAQGPAELIPGKIGSPVSEVADGQSRLLSLRELERMRDSLGPDIRLLSREEHDQMKKAFEGFAQGFNQPVIKIENINAGIGDVKTASQAQVLKFLDQGFWARNKQELETLLPTMFKPQQITLEPGRFSQQRAQEIAERLQSNASLFVEGLDTVPRVMRMSPEALSIGLKEAETKMTDPFYKRGLESAILDMENKYDPLTNTHSKAVYIGKTDKTFFTGPDGKEQAIYAAQLKYKLPKSEYTIEQQGLGWFIKLERKVDETSNAVREAMVIHTDNQTPVTTANVLFGKVRSSKYVTSQMAGEKRDAVTHAQQLLQGFSKAVGDNLAKLSNKQLDRIEQIMFTDRDRMAFHETLGSFEKAYTAKFKELPTVDEAVAYFTQVQFNNFDLLLRDLNYSRDLSRQGVGLYSVPYFKEGGSTRYKTGQFYGREVDSLPIGRHGGVLVVNEENKSQKYYRLNNPDHAKALQDVTTLIEEKGYKITQVADPLSRPLKEHAGDYVNFVISKSNQREELGWNLIPNKPGGHKLYDAPNTVKQAVIGKHGGRQSYEGDTTLFGFDTHAQATKYAGKMEDVRRLYNAGDRAALETYLAKNFPAENFSVDQVIDRFASGVWDKDSPFVALRSGRTVMKDYPELFKNYGSFYDEATSEFNLMQNVDRTFLGERDQNLWTIIERGSDTSPLYELGSARMVDPLETLYRSIGNSTHSMLYNDYRTYHVESWAQEFGKALNVSQEAINRNPLYHMLKPSWDSGVDPAVKAAAMNSRNAALAFLSMDPPDVQALKYIQGKLLDSVYRRLGQGPSDFLARHLLPNVSDPFQYMRNMVFDMKMGLFSIPQFFNQIQTAAHAIAVAGPVKGLRGMAAATATDLLRLTEEEAIHANVAGRLAPLGWKADDFLEARKMLFRSGFYEVQGETAFRNAIEYESFVKRGASKFLEWGRAPFQEGERFSRLTGWFTAYQDFKQANPRYKFGTSTLEDNNANQWIVARANLYNVDMTRSAQAPWQRGIASLPTQFLAYYTRLTEQMLGNRLTTSEKLRVMATYSALYGIPSGVLLSPWLAAPTALVTDGVAGAVSSWFGQWPMADSVRQYALEKRIDVDNGFFRAAMVGLPQYIMEFALGQQYQSRVNPQGPTAIRDLLHGDKDWQNLVMGVSGETVMNIGEALSPVMHGLSQMFQGNSEAFPFVLQDVQAIASTISSVNTNMRAFYMAMYGQYATRSANIVAGDMTMQDATMMSVFGMTRQDVADIWHKSDIMSTRKSAQEFAEKQIKTEMRRFFQAAESDPEGAKAFLSRAQKWYQVGGFNHIEYQRIIREAMKGREYLIDRINADFYFRKAPVERQLQTLDKALEEK